jgi:putative FmdB family regulatory protein
MPTYDYLCDACGHSWELFQKISDDPIKDCPECNRKKARRLFGTGAAVVFKGSGFYQTDYRSDSYKKRAEAEKSTSGESSDSSAKSADSKPEKAANSEPGSKSDAKSSGSPPVSDSSKSKTKKRKKD